MQIKMWNFKFEVLSIETSNRKIHSSNFKFEVLNCFFREKNSIFEAI